MMTELNQNIAPLDLQYEIKKLLGTQKKCAKHFKVTEGAISGAINNDPLLKSLRIRIIEYLNTLKKRAA